MALQERQIDRRECRDNSDVHYQPRPEVVPEEQDVHGDHDGYQREHVKDDGYLSSHSFVLLRATDWSKSGAGRGQSWRSWPRAARSERAMAFLAAGMWLMIRIMVRIAGPATGVLAPTPRPGVMVWMASPISVTLVVGHWGTGTEVRMLIGKKLSGSARAISWRRFSRHRRGRDLAAARRLRDQHRQRGVPHRGAGRALRRGRGDPLAGLGGVPQPGRIASHLAAVKPDDLFRAGLELLDGLEQRLARLRAAPPSDLPSMVYIIDVTHEIDLEPEVEG
jgi:hypothetical protein